MSLATDMQALADQLKASRALYLAAMPRPKVVSAPQTVRVMESDRECLLCGGTESGRHSWHGFTGTCTCEVMS